MYSDRRFAIPREDIDNIPLYPKVSVKEVGRSARIEALYELVHKLGTGERLSFLYRDDILLELQGVSDTI